MSSNLKPFKSKDPIIHNLPEGSQNLMPLSHKFTECFQALMQWAIISENAVVSHNFREGSQNVMLSDIILQKAFKV